MAFLKLIASILPVFLAIRKARNDYIVANKRTSTKKKAALRSSFQTAVAGGVGSLIVGVCLFGAEIFDNQHKERVAVDRHQDIRTNLVTPNQIVEIVKTELRATALQQQRIRSQELSRKYPNGYVIFSVSESFVSDEMYNWDTNQFKARWETAEVEELTRNSLLFRMPDVSAYGSVLEGNRVHLNRAAGSTVSPIRPMIGMNVDLQLHTNLHLTVEVLTNSPIGVTMLLGTKVEVMGRNGPL